MTNQIQNNEAVNATESNERIDYAARLLLKLTKGNTTVAKGIVSATYGIVMYGAVRVGGPLMIGGKILASILGTIVIEKGVGKGYSLCSHLHDAIDAIAKEHALKETVKAETTEEPSTETA